MGCKHGDITERAEEVQPSNLVQEQNLEEGLKTEVRDIGMRRGRGKRNIGQKTQFAPIVSWYKRYLTFLFGIESF